MLIKSDVVLETVQVPNGNNGNVGFEAKEGWPYSNQDEVPPVFSLCYKFFLSPPVNSLFCEFDSYVVFGIKSILTAF